MNITHIIFPGPQGPLVAGTAKKALKKEASETTPARSKPRVDRIAQFTRQLTRPH